MKRLVIVIILSLALINIPVNAKEVVITTPNTLEQTYLDTSGYITSDNIDFTKVGNYKQDYFNLKDKTFFTKDINICNLETLETGFTIRYNYELYF